VAQAPRPPAKAAPPAKPAAAAAAARKDGSHAAAKAPAAEPPATPPEAHAFVCDSCGAQFEVALKFCGECGKPMKVAR
jgi:hypothetical protein